MTKPSSIKLLPFLNFTIFCFVLFFLSFAESDSGLCIKYRVKKPKPEKKDNIISEKKEKQHLVKDEVSSFWSQHAVSDL